MLARDGGCRPVTVFSPSPAAMPTFSSKDRTDGLGGVPSVLEKSRTDCRRRPLDGTVDITGWPRIINSASQRHHGFSVDSLV
jgi:hypothetical protein